jgi:hypothetical protein
MPPTTLSCPLPMTILQRENLFLLFYPYPLLLAVIAGCSTQTLAVVPPCGRRRFFSAMPSELETEALRQWLDALVKDADAAEQPVVDDLERKEAVTKGLLPSSSSSSTTPDLVNGATYNLTLVTNLHVQATVVPNVHQLVNIVVDTTSSNYNI